MRAGNALLAGAIGGLAGGLAMMATMMMGKRTGMIEETLPHKVEQWIERRLKAESRTKPAQEQLLSQGGHLMFSAALGAVYGGLQAIFRLPTFPTGPLYGLAIYVIDLAGIGPALDLTPGPRREKPMTAGRRLMMHVLFGLVTALVSERVLHALEDMDRENRARERRDSIDYMPRAQSHIYAE